MDLLRFFLVEHEPAAVLMSVLIAVCSWWGALAVGGRLAGADPRLAAIWQAAGALLLGFGIWAFHFVGMLGWRPGLTLAFNGPMTLLSLLVSIAGAWPVMTGLRRAEANGVSWRHVLGFAAGLGGMHYLGLQAADVAPGPLYAPGWVLVSLALALGLGAGAMRLKRWIRSAPEGQRLGRRAGAALVLGLALCAVHYAGVAAASYPAGAVCQTEGALSGDQLAGMVVLSAVLCLSSMLWLTASDARAESRQQRLADQLQARAKVLEHMVHFDPVTGLPNRAALEARLASLGHHAAVGAALIHLDLHGYQTVFDSWGNERANDLIRQAARRIQLAVPGHAYVVRVSDDKFKVLLEAGPQAQPLEALVQTLHEVMQQPFEIGSLTVSLGCRLGLAEVEQPDDLLRITQMARSASDYARRAGTPWKRFESHMLNNAREDLELQGALRRAIERHELSLAYQPKALAADGSWVAVEALLRWRHPQQGWIGPARFIPVAERFGLMGALGDWVLQEAIGQLAEWHAQGLRIRMAINLSTQQLEQDRLVEAVAALLRQHALDAHWICLEITESAAMLRPQHTRQQLQQLRQLGLELAIDDFGTGHSSLSYLHTLPVTELKIDRSFVIDMDRGSLPIIEATVRMAKALGLRVVAEGVETEAQRRQLTAIGCDELQGYLLARPMPAAGIPPAFEAARPGGKPQSTGTGRLLCATPRLAL